jgi:hypothetical protein
MPPTFNTLERQMTARGSNRSTGFSRELKACPESGRISFADIAGTRGERSNVNCDDEKFLITRKMIDGMPPSEGNQIIVPNKHYHPEPTDDPSDYYGAFFGHGHEFVRSEDPSVNEIGEWIEQFSGPYPSSFDDRGVEVLTNSDGEDYFRLYAYSDDWNGSNYEEKATYLVSYIGKVEAGTKLRVYVEYDADCRDREDVSSVFSLRGWTDGYFQGESKDYIEREFRGYGRWQCYVWQITVDSEHRDLWAAWQQNSLASRKVKQNTYFRKLQIWRT